MREACQCGDFGRRISRCLVMVWTTLLWIVCLGGVFCHSDSAFFMTPLLPVDFWSRLRISWVVGWMYGDTTIALTLPSPLLRTQP